MSKRGVVGSIGRVPYKFISESVNDMRDPFSIKLIRLRLAHIRIGFVQLIQCNGILKQRA